MDRTDKAILEALQKDARMTNLELSERVNLSPSACLRRVGLLEKSGAVSGYHAEINDAAVGYRVSVLVQVTLDGQSSELLNEFEEAVERIPNVLACFLIAGVNDYILRVIAKDVDDYSHIHTHYLARLPHVKSMESNFVMRKVITRGLSSDLL